MSEPFSDDLVNHKNIVLAIVAIYGIEPDKAQPWARELLERLKDPEYWQQTEAELTWLLYRYDEYKKNQPIIVRTSDGNDDSGKADMGDD